jgi:hypothetical protein
VFTNNDDVDENMNDVHCVQNNDNEAVVARVHNKIADDKWE